MTRPFAHVDDEGRPSDSVGQAWQGKEIPSHGFADDSGEAAPGLVDALLACAADPTPEGLARAYIRGVADYYAAVTGVAPAYWLALFSAAAGLDRAPR